VRQTHRTHRTQGIIFADVAEEFGTSEPYMGKNELDSDENEVYLDIQSFNHLDTEGSTRVRYRADGALKSAGSQPFSRPGQLHCLGRNVFFSILYPCSCSGPYPTYTGDRSPLKIAGNKQARPGNKCWWAPDGPGQELLERYPSRPSVRAGPG